MKVQADQYFAIIPEWVLYADVSPAAIRVYGTLNRYANDNTGKCHPSRATIAKKCHINVKTVDRAIQELIALGAVVVEHRKVDGTDEWASNEYTVIMSPPGVKNTPPWGKFDATGRDKNGKRTKASNNQSQEPEISPSSVDDEFPEFWKLYPRKIGKDGALISYRRARKKAKKEDILAGLHLYLLTCPKEKHYIAHPTTWLNQGRWADETDEPMNPEPEPETPNPYSNWEPCGNCHGGWIYQTDDRGYETASPCICRP